MHKLVIVESPNKIKAIQKYLGDQYKVVASVGHIVNLTTKGKYGLGIDFNNWEPLNEIAAEKKRVFEQLKSEVKTSSLVYIATDPDREGEAIGENLVDFLKIQDKYLRIRYHEITEKAILKALQNPEKIDYDLVKAQKTRRILDRIIGFRISKLMKTKIRNAYYPSAGRVQSIALKLCVDREKEIEAFVSEKYYHISATLEDGFELFLHLNQNPKDPKWVKPKDYNKIIDSLKGDLKVTKIKVQERNDTQATPFKQAQLYKKSPFSARKTQILAQKLFEGFGAEGLITYPRTDSIVYSQTFIDEAKTYIETTFGKAYFLKNAKIKQAKAGAHEAIRPTFINLSPEKARAKYAHLMGAEVNELIRLYALIYYNALSALMSPARRQSMRLSLENHNYLFIHTQSKIIFDGFFKATQLPEKKSPTYNFQIGDQIKVLSYQGYEKQTLAPPRYNDGSLIEKLDSIKVGRPSTFASTVQLIVNKNYVTKETKELKPTNFGKILISQLLSGFPDIINESYTASLEKDLDQIAIGVCDYKTILENFWNYFNETLLLATKELEILTMPNQLVGEACPLCKDELVYKTSKFGRFISCANFPNCEYKRSLVKERGAHKAFMNRFKTKRKV